MNVESPMERKRHELLEDMVAQTVRILTALGHPEEEARVAGNAMADHFARQWGGQLINFPMDFRWLLDQRDMALYDARQAGASYSDLAKQFQISDRHVRTVIATVTRRLREQRRLGPPGQGDFFGG